MQASFFQNSFLFVCKWAYPNSIETYELLFLSRSEMHASFNKLAKWSIISDPLMECMVLGFKLNDKEEFLATCLVKGE